VSAFSPNGWQDIYGIQSWIWKASHLLDTELFVCYQQGKCDEAENSSATWQQLALSGDDQANLLAVIFGSASLYDASPQNVILRKLNEGTPPLKPSDKPPSAPDQIQHARITAFTIFGWHQSLLAG
jgi:hypothetical protein